MTPEEVTIAKLTDENQKLKSEVIWYINSSATDVRENLEADIRLLTADRNRLRDILEQSEKVVGDLRIRCSQYEDNMGSLTYTIEKLNGEKVRWDTDRQRLAQIHQYNADLIRRHGEAVATWDAERKSLTEKLGVFNHKDLDVKCVETGCQSAKLNRVEWELAKAEQSLGKIQEEAAMWRDINAKTQEKLAKTQTLLKKLYESQGSLWDGAAELLPKGVENG